MHDEGGGGSAGARAANDTNNCLLLFGRFIKPAARGRDGKGGRGAEGTNNNQELFEV